MASEGSLPCSKKYSNGPYPQPDHSSPYYPILRSILILSTNYHLGLPFNEYFLIIVHLSDLGSEDLREKPSVALITNETADL
jgi:hypothetical protein